MPQVQPPSATDASAKALAMSGPESTDKSALLDLVLSHLDDDQAQDVVTIDLEGKSSIADYMVIASGRSTRQVAAIATKLAPWNPTTVYHSRTKKDVPYTYYDNLEAMAADSDILICITPGGAETRKIVNAEVLAALGPKGTLINVARGSVVDETALIDALQSGKLGWAGLDVFEQEPKVPQALRDLPNTVLLPHVGSATVETRTAMANLTVENLLQHLETGTVATPVPECATDR